MIKPPHIFVGNPLTFDTRWLEFWLAIFAINRGLAWLLHPSAFDDSFYAPLSSIGSAEAWGCTFILAGAFMLAGIYINGAWKRSPWLRFAGLIILGFCSTSLALMFWSATSSASGWQAFLTQACFALSAYCTAIAVASNTPRGARHGIIN